MMYEATRLYNELGYKPSEISRSLNCALITWKTNRNISDKEPERYLAERFDDTGVNEQEIRQRISKHIIPYDEMVAGDYDAFLRTRAEMMHAKMLDVCRIENDA